MNSIFTIVFDSTLYLVEVWHHKLVTLVTELSDFFRYYSCKGSLIIWEEEDMIWKKYDFRTSEENMMYLSFLLSKPKSKVSGMRMTNNRCCINPVREYYI